MRSPPEESSHLMWIRSGAVAGMLAVASYSLLLFGSGSEGFGFLVGSVFGVGLGVAAYGLFQFVWLHRRTAAAQVAVVATMVGSVVFVLMMATQLSIRAPLPSPLRPIGLGAARELADRVHFGLDLAWDLYFALGMWMFGLTAFTHPRLGRVLGVSGMLIATALLAVNLATFPLPPAGAGSIDLGPVAGLWYLAVT
ncbi:MAG TPA: hypothetical protein VLA54_05815, partial [Acidimicrobiia bacterium]|nr:hypothetical protein [Acidimicrobiia bacterium]